MIPRTVYEHEHEQFRDSVRKFFEAEAVPFHSQWEKDGQIDRNLWMKAGELGFLVPTADETYGGVGVDFRYNAIISEEASRLGLSGVGFFLHSDIAVPYILNNGTEAQKQKYIPGCISGETIVAIAMTEPGTGSDLQGINTTAVLDGDEYVREVHRVVAIEIPRTRQVDHGAAQLQLVGVVRQRAVALLLSWR